MSAIVSAAADRSDAKRIATLEHEIAVLRQRLAEHAAERDEARAQHTATTEVLRVINASTGDLGPVFDAVLDRALALCEAAFGILWTYDGDKLHATAMRGASEAYVRFLTAAPFQPAAGEVQTRLLAGAPFVHVIDVAATEEYHAGKPLPRAMVDIGGGRSLIAVALRRDGLFLGDMVIYRREVRPFTDKQIALLQNFAAQAVIAMENARLLTETREALAQQTATTEVLRVINASPGDLEPVFDAMVERAARLCEADEAALRTFDGGLLHLVAVHGSESRVVERLRQLGPTRAFGLYEGFARGESIVHFADVRETAVFRDDPVVRERLEIRGIRSWLAIALRKDGTLRGVINVHRREVRPFTAKQIALLQNFAAQAVIAMENARLITETRDARDAAETALRDLRAAQANLVHAQKMAALGQLTAGIAHEIKNPLNFVNNFSALSIELLDELKEAAAPALAALDADRRAEIDETIAMLTGNLDKIAEHGRRADNIVRSMLEHSRGASGERRAVDLNGLVEEALNLAYHGGRARDQGFNVTLERDYAPALAPIELVPQDITRVCLNLFGNGFYAISKRRDEGADATYRPTLRVATRELGDAVEIRVRDNGIGIPDASRDRLFQPFFTTKPPGEGTGLGLSISHDIVTQQHGGTITVASRAGEFTEFVVRLPRARSAGATG
jgi:two-component system NtrC family sensor kinase